MAVNESGDGRQRLVRVLLTIGLAVGAIASLRKRKRLLAALSGTGALVVGYSIVVSDGSPEMPDVERANSVDSTSARGEMRCSICGEPIVVGQGRQPHDNHGTVHDACIA